MFQPLAVCAEQLKPPVHRRTALSASRMAALPHIGQIFGNLKTLPIPLDIRCTTCGMTSPAR